MKELDLWDLTSNEKEMEGKINELVRAFNKLKRQIRDSDFREVLDNGFNLNTSLYTEEEVKKIREETRWKTLNDLYGEWRMENDDPEYLFDLLWEKLRKYNKKKLSKLKLGKVKK